jgi:hypothetical protein
MHAARAGTSRRNIERRSSLVGARRQLHYPRRHAPADTQTARADIQPRHRSGRAGGMHARPGRGGRPHEDGRQQADTARRFRGRVDLDQRQRRRLGPRAGHLPHAYRIALGGCIALGASLLLAAVVIAFRGLSPKWYRGIDVSAPVARTTPSALRGEPAGTIAKVAAGRRDIFLHARAVNNNKAGATTRAFTCAGVGFGLLVAGLIVTAVGSVV